MNKEITLSRPLTHGKETISVLKLREPVAGDFRIIGDMSKPFAVALDFGAQLSGVPARVLDGMAPADLKQLTELVTGYLGESLGTGTTP